MFRFKKYINDDSPVFAKIALYRQLGGWYVMTEEYIPYQDAINRATELDDVMAAVVYNSKGWILFKNKEAKLNHYVKGLKQLSWVK